MLFVDHRGHAARGNGGRPAASGCGGRWHVSSGTRAAMM
jgi:hypothetical protein